MTNDFTYRFTDCKSCRYNWERSTECAEWGEWGRCDECSNRKVISDDSDTIECRCLEQATGAKTCPYYVEDKK